jgi:hypothetical protein
MTSDEQEHLREDVVARQRNVVPHDQLRNGVGVDALLWRGNPKASRVQRAGMIVFASFFLATFVGFFAVAIESHSVLWGLMSLVWLVVAGRFFRNALLR